MTSDPAFISFGLAVIFGLAIAYVDLKTMQIPNKLTIACFAAITGAYLLLLPIEAVMWRVAGAAIVLAVGIAFFFLSNAFGGGDAKAAAALAPLVAPFDAGAVLIILSINGLLAALFLYVARKLRRHSDPNGWAVWNPGGRVPYGLVLGLAAIQYTGLVVIFSK